MVLFLFRFQKSSQIINIIKTILLNLSHYKVFFLITLLSNDFFFLNVIPTNLIIISIEPKF